MPTSRSAAANSASPWSRRRGCLGSHDLLEALDDLLSGRLKWSEWDAEDGRRQAIEIHAASIVPIATIKDAWELHEDHGDNVNLIAGETDIPF